MRTLYKIVHTTCHSDWGGLEKRIYEESQWMISRGHKVTLVAPKGTPLYDRAEENGIQVYPMEFRFLNRLSDHKAMVKILKKERPHIINSHGNADARVALPAAKKAGVACRILSQHINGRVQNSWYNRRLYKHLNHFVFTATNEATRHIMKTFKLKDTQVLSIPNGIIEPDSLMDKDEARKQLAAHLGLTETTRFIGFTGRVSRDKGVDILIRAFAKLIRQIPHHLIIVGKGDPSHIKELMGLIQAKHLDDRVHFMGFQENIWPFYRAMDCKILPSRNRRGTPTGGVPKSLMEAMYASCPVIGSNNEGICDIIKDKSTGLLFGQERVTELADCIYQTILHRETAALERVYSAREWVKKHHTIDAMGRNVIRIYRLHQVRAERERMGY